MRDITQTFPPNNKFSGQEKHDMYLAIENLQNLGAISVCDPCDEQFISKIFLAPKANGGFRFILNLKPFNKFVQKCHFKMEDYRTAAKLIPNGSFMATIDLKEAYLSVPIFPPDRKYLRFQFENKTYEFNSMPYGLSVAPRTFTKIMKEVISHLRSRGFTSVIYLDDILCIGNNYTDCLRNITETLSLLECLGFVVNYDKSCLQPKQCCKFLGFIYNSLEMSICLPIDKRSNILRLVQKFKSLPMCPLRDYAHLIGVLTAACPAVKYGWLYTKLLERQKFLALQKHNVTYDTKIKFSKEVIPDLDWWEKTIQRTSNPIGPLCFEIEIFTDASLTGWGAFCNNRRANGKWKDSELDSHINYLELQAVFFGLKCFASNLSECTILLRIDNTTAISYVNRMGGVQFPHLSNLARSIWQWCEERKLWLFASYINTKDNVEADEESRRINPDIEWELSNIAFQRIVQAFGQPEIDLFASRTNAKCETYVSWKRDPDAIAVDAFTLSWKPRYFYAFPPFCLILKCLQKIISDEAEGILIFPVWPSQPWFPLLNSIIVSNIIYIDPNNLISSSFRTHHRPLRQCTLAAARLSGWRLRDEALQRHH